MYIIEKQGVYSHGVFWIGEEVDEGLCKLKNLCSKDSDNYHIWKLSEFSEEQEPRYDARHATLLEISKVSKTDSEGLQPLNDYFRIHYVDSEDRTVPYEVILSDDLESILEEVMIERCKDQIKDVHDNKQPTSFKIGMD